MTIMLEIDDLVFAYNSHPVLKNLHFRIPAGRLVSLVGPNGSGKSTLLKCIDRILRPHQGKIFLDKNEVARMKRSELARAATYVPQGSARGFAHTVFEIVLMGRRPHSGWTFSKKDKETVWGVLARLGLESLALRPFSALSGGQQQKVLIARALAQETGLVMLDEPTSNLDLWHQLDVMTVIKMLTVREGTSVLIAMHDLNLAARFSDTILMMKAGAVTGMGPPKSVLTAENIAAVYGVEAVVDQESDAPYVVPLRRIA